MNNEMDLVIVTGLSGAGKTSALNVLEDEGYLCVDNLPTPLINEMVKLMNETPDVTKVALALDQRNRIFNRELYSIIQKLKDELNARVLFLNSSDEVLIKRFKERRRPHPMSPKGSIVDGIKRERDSMMRVKEISKVIDTGSLSLGELKIRIHETLGDADGDVQLVFTTFGFKHGIVMDADLVFDVRFVTNPYYIPELKNISGYDDRVYRFVTDNPDVIKFLDKAYDMIDYLLPLYKREGKEQLMVAFGCTGGRQRSVAVARRLKEMFDENNRHAILINRDLEDR